MRSFRYNPLLSAPTVLALCCLAFPANSLTIQASFDPNDFDFALESLTIAPGDTDAFVPPRHPFLGALDPGTPYLAWIDNDVGSGTPDMVLVEFDGLESFTATTVTYANLLSSDDNSSPIGSGTAPAIFGVVQPDGAIYLCASVFDDFDCDTSSDSGGDLTGGSGAYSFFLKLNPQGVVPEPSLSSLVALSLAALAWRVRRGVSA